MAEDWRPVLDRGIPAAGEQQTDPALDRFDEDPGAWRKVLDANTPYYALPTIIEQQTDLALASLRERLAADVDLTPDERAALVVKARPLILDRTRAAVMSAWERLQVAGTVH